MRGADGWLKTLPCWLLFLRRRSKRRQKMRRPSNAAAPSTDPITIPAIAPPDSPRLVSAAPAEPAGPAALVADEVLDDVDRVLADVDVGKSGCIENMVGSLTFEQRDSTLEVTQHESVAFGELAPQ